MTYKELVRKASAAAEAAPVELRAYAFQATLNALIYSRQFNQMARFLANREICGEKNIDPWRDYVEINGE